MNDKILIIGNGDLSKEFISFWELDEKYVKVIAFIDDIDQKYLKDQFDKIYIAISDPSIRKKVYEQLKSYRITPNTYIHPSAHIGRRTVIGSGCIIQPNTIVSNDVVIKDSVFINNSSNIGHNSVIGDFCSIMTDVNLGGHCVLRKNIFIGTGAILIPKVEIKSNITIGLGSVVIKNLKKEGSYFGNPARLIG